MDPRLIRLNSARVAQGSARVSRPRRNARQLGSARVSRPRRGVTLLEVVFSIGVVVIGLLGVIALMPLAARYAEQGVTADRSAYFGRAAVEEFSLRAYSRPDLWVQWFDATETPNGVAGFYPLIKPGQSHSDTNWRYSGRFSGWWFRHPTAGGSGTYYLEYSPTGGQAFCIDPRMLANNIPTGINAPQRWFPYYPPAGGEPRMARISLRSGPTSANLPMNLLQADQVFTSADALSLQLPTDRTLEPLQLYSSAVVGPDGAAGRAGVDDDRDGEVDNNSELGWPGSDDISAQRLAERRLSWFATLVPRLDAQGGASGSDLYTLSIVVIKDRPGDMAIESALTAASPTDPVNERVMSVVFNGGPEVRLVSQYVHDPSSPTTPEDEDRLRAEMDLEANQWIMLSANTLTGRLVTDINGNLVPQLGAPAFRWYRVVSTDAKILRYDQNNLPETDPGFDTAGPWTYTRNVTLEGADWDRPEWHSPGLYIPGNPGGRVLLPTQATVVTGAVSVHERTIRLETSSLWNLGS